MKKILYLLMATHLALISLHSQAIDTVTTVNYGKMPPVYFSNKVFWERNYDNKNHLLFEGLKYNECFIGAFVNYWSNGTVKTIGKYLSNSSGDWNNLRDRGLCSVMDGEWKNYNDAGELISTIIYNKGIVIKQD